MVKVYTEPVMSVNKFDCEKVEVTASRVMRQWQGDNENAQVRAIDFEDLNVFE